MAAKIAQRDPDEEIAKAFALFDEAGRGKIGPKDLKRVARELGEALADGELQEMIDEADRDGERLVGAVPRGCLAARFASKNGAKSLAACPPLLKPPPLFFPDGQRRRRRRRV